ncbi:MAG TPA: PQQ-binding-like beta-propeller repeat protein [Candidatus Bathyarchaeia archaeon]|nr:PQQ-binding-like beta-propeller repeat protein [Candidatus Bathyarchaeia archaeon]
MQTVSLKRVSRMLSSMNKVKTSAVAFVALLALSAVMTILPAFAQYTAVPDRETGTVVGASPTLIGLGQKTLINIMTYPAPSGPTLYAQDLVTKFGGWQGISVTITKPDGTKDTFMPIDTSLEQIGIEVPGQGQIVGSLQFFYEPDQVGIYSVTASFPGQIYTTDEQYKSLNLSVYYKPSSSSKVATFTVQEELVLAGLLNGWPWSPLPTAYWTNPVSTDNREWAAISGDWLQATYDSANAINYNPYSTAPNSPHIIWANEVGKGGLPGGVWGSLPYGGGGGAGAIVLDGKIYQNGKSGYFDCVDLRTGKMLWSVPGSVTLAQRIDPFYQTAAQANEGSISVWLWGLSTSSWTRYNPFNGDVMQTITGVPNDIQTRAFSEGNPIVWVTQRGGWNTTLPLKYAYEYLIKWNHTKVASNNNWLTGIEWNVSVRQPDGVGIGDGRQSVMCSPYDEANVVVVKAHNDENIIMGFDMTTGAYLYRAYTAMDLGTSASLANGGPNGPYILFDGATQNFIAYNVKTGQEQWRASTGELPWAMLPDYRYVVNVEKGIFYAGSYDGHVYAYDADTGDLVWQSDFYGAEDESIYGTQPFNGGWSVGADEKLYFNTATTYSLMPRTRFHALMCIDEATGHFLWKLPIGAAPTAIADGYLIATDGENGIQYGIGKGQTATAVSIQNDVISAGSSVLIKGSVLDLSPGAPNTAAVSEADMSVWMDYLYGQNATLLNSPPTPEGVSVQLTALGSDGSAIDLGTVTSDESGQYAKAWTPSSEGLYKIYATFAGSESYWSSWAETPLSVVAAAESPTPTQPTGVVTSAEVMTYVVVAAIAIIIAIAIVGALLLKKGKQ